MVYWTFPATSISWKKLNGSGSSLKEEQNVGLFGLPPQDVVAKMREIPVCIRLQADHTGIDGLEFSDADHRFDPNLKNQLITATDADSSVKCGFPSSAADRLDTRTTGVSQIIRCSKDRLGSGCRSALGDSNFRHSRRRPTRTILVNVRSTRPPTRRPMKPPRRFDPFDRGNLGMSSRRGPMLVPPTNRNQRREASIPADAWSP